MTNQVAINYLHAFLERHQLKTFKKGEIIIFQGEVPRCAYFIQEGAVKAYNLSSSGDEKPIDFYAVNQVFPSSWVYGKSASAIYYYEAFTPEVKLYAVDRGEFVNFIKQRPELLYQELERLLVDQLGGSLRLNALQHSKASDKLIYTLHYLALTHGQPAGSGSMEITLDLTHQDFANLTGLTRETAATELNKLKRQKVITYGKGQLYKLNLERLTKLLNDQFIAELKPATLAS